VAASDWIRILDTTYADLKLTRTPYACEVLNNVISVISIPITSCDGVLSSWQTNVNDKDDQSDDSQSQIE
jgi:hypothetical protein